MTAAGTKSKNDFFYSLLTLSLSLSFLFSYPFKWSFCTAPNTDAMYVSDNMKCLCVNKCACELVCVFTITYISSRAWYYAPFCGWVVLCLFVICSVTLFFLEGRVQGAKRELRWGLHFCPVARLQSPISKRQAQSGCHGNLSCVKGEWFCGGTAMPGFYTHTHTAYTIMHQCVVSLVETMKMGGIKRSLENTTEVSADLKPHSTAK